MKSLSRLFMQMMTFVTLMIFGCSIFFPNNITYPSNPFISLMIAILICMIWIFLYRKTNSFFEKFTKKQETIFLILYFACFFLIEFFIFQELKVTPGWDFGEIYHSAISYTNHTPLAFPAYFEYCPNNIFLYLCYIVLFKIASVLHITDYLTLLGICNIILIGLSIFLLFLVAKKMFTKSCAYFILILVLFFSPLFLYTPIIYTDTVTMCIPILLIYLFLKIEDSNKKSQWLWILLFSLTA